jgi:hypothetical protein
VTPAGEVVGPPVTYKITRSNAECNDFFDDFLFDFMSPTPSTGIDVMGGTQGPFDKRGVDFLDLAG